MNKKVPTHAAFLHDPREDTMSTMVTLLFSDNILIGSFVFKHACDVCSAFYFTFIQLNLCKLTGQEIALHLTHTFFLEPDKILFRILVLLL